MNFGLSKRMKGMQLETQCCGSPGYTAPEVANKEGYGVKADIYSCGVVLYVLYASVQGRLTGVFPFGPKLAEEVYFPQDVWKDVSAEALDLTVKMTERDQYKRLTAKECLGHPWFSAKHSKQPLKNVLARLKDSSPDIIGQIEDIKFFTSSPLAIRKQSVDSCSKASLSDVQMDLSPYTPYAEQNTTFTQRMQELLFRARAKSVPRSLRSADPRTAFNPFLSAVLSEEEKSRAGEEEIPAESEQSAGPVRAVRDCIAAPEGVSKKLLVNSTHFVRKEVSKSTMTLNVLRAYHGIVHNGSIKDTKDSEATIYEEIVHRRRKSVQN